jgi:hypothetical protein
LNEFCRQLAVDEYQSIANTNTVIGLRNEMVSIFIISLFSKLKARHTSRLVYSLILETVDEKIAPDFYFISMTREVRVKMLIINHA